MISLQVIEKFDPDAQKGIANALTNLIKTGVVEAQKRHELELLTQIAEVGDDEKLAAQIKVYRRRFTELTQLEELTNQLKRTLT